MSVHRICIELSTVSYEKEWPALSYTVFNVDSKCVGYFGLFDLIN